MPTSAQQQLLQASVTCTCGPAGEQQPVSFRVWQKSILVEELIDRWLAAQHAYFKVRGDDANTYILRYDSAAADWELHYYEKHSLPAVLAGHTLSAS